MRVLIEFYYMGGHVVLHNRVQGLSIVNSRYFYY